MLCHRFLLRCFAFASFVALFSTGTSFAQRTGRGLFPQSYETPVIQDPDELPAGQEQLAGMVTEIQALQKDWESSSAQFSTLLDEHVKLEEFGREVPDSGQITAGHEGLV